MKKSLVIMLNCIIVLMSVTFCTFGQDKSSDLKEKRITLKMDKRPLWVVFKYLMEKYDIAIGLEESSLDSDKDDFAFETNLPKGIDGRSESMDGKLEITEELKPIVGVKQRWFTVNVENERLENALNIIVQQMGSYKWEINDEVVNIFPVEGRDERYSKLLNLNIQSFYLKNPVYISSIRDSIFNLPEVVQFLDKNNLYFTLSRTTVSIDNLDRFLVLEIKFSNLTFRNLLNKITKVKRGGWILKKNSVYGSKGREYIEIDI